ncbi:MAG: PEP-CTERM sorting domain-containing protein [Opitutales bacterium]
MRVFFDLLLRIAPLQLAATHFKGIHLTWSQTTDNNPETARIDGTTYFRHSTSWIFQDPFYEGFLYRSSTETSSPPRPPQSWLGFDTLLDIREATFTEDVDFGTGGFGTYTAGGTESVYFQLTGRSSTLFEGNNDRPLYARAILAFAPDGTPQQSPLVGWDSPSTGSELYTLDTNGQPDTFISPWGWNTLYLPRNESVTFRLPGYDPDGGAVSWAFAPGGTNGSGMVTAVPGTTFGTPMTITDSASGIFAWDTPDVDGLFAAQVYITDDEGNRVPWEFQIRLTDRVAYDRSMLMAPPGVIPEPEAYALVFALAAGGLAWLRRHRQIRSLNRRV